jgi:hypothetical protein
VTLRRAIGPARTLRVPERISALQALLHRLDTRSRGDTTAPEQLNPAAQALGPSLNLLLLSATVQAPTPPAFLGYAPAPYLRPFNLPPFVPNVAGQARVDTAA